MNTVYPIKSDDTTSVRTHIVMPEKVIRQLDRLVGSRGRSKFVVEAVVARISHIKLQQVASKVAGSLRDTPISGWETGENASAWVREQRREADTKPNHSI